MENPEKIIQKIESGEVRVRGVHVPEPKESKSIATQEGSAHNADQNAADAKVGTTVPGTKVDAQAQAITQESTKAPKPKAQKAPKEPKEPAKPKVAEFPFKPTINPYGFIGLGKDELRALGLSVVEEKGAKEKLKAGVPITVSAWNPETKTLTIKVS